MNDLAAAKPRTQLLEALEHGELCWFADWPIAAVPFWTADQGDKRASSEAGLKGELVLSPDVFGGARITPRGGPWIFQAAGGR